MPLTARAKVAPYLLSLARIKKRGHSMRTMIYKASPEQAETSSAFLMLVLEYAHSDLFSTAPTVSNVSYG